MTIDGLGEWKEEQGTELCARNCKESCGHGSSAWVADVDKWLCDECLIALWWDELSELALQRCGWDGDTNENALLDRMHYLAMTDEDDEMAGFRVSSPIAWVDPFTVTVGEMEEVREFDTFTKEKEAGR
jgi:hypothetical protein